MAPFTPVDKGPRIGRIMQDLDECRLCWFAPEQVPRMESPMLASWQQNPIIAQTAEDFLTTAECDKAGKNEVEGMVHLLVWVFDHLALGQPH